MPMHFACRHIKSDGVRCDAAAMRGSWPASSAADDRTYGKATYRS